MHVCNFLFPPRSFNSQVRPLRHNCSNAMSNGKFWRHDVFNIYPYPKLDLVQLESIKRIEQITQQSDQPSKIDRTSPKDLQVLDNAVVVTVGFSKQIKLHQLSNYQLNMKLSLRKCYNYSQIKRYFSYQFINPQTTIKD